MSDNRFLTTAQDAKALSREGRDLLELREQAETIVEEAVEALEEALGGQAVVVRRPWMSTPAADATIVSFGPAGGPPPEPVSAFSVHLALGGYPAEIRVVGGPAWTAENEAALVGALEAAMKHPNVRAAMAWATGT